MFLSNQEWYAAKAAKCSNTIAGKLLCEYYTRMAEAETPREGVGSGEMNTLRVVIRSDMKKKMEAQAFKHEVVCEVADNFRATCYVFADGSFLRSDVFA